MAGLDDRRVKCCFRSDTRLTGRILFDQLLNLFSQAENTGTWYYGKASAPNYSVMGGLYKTGDEIEVLAEAFDDLSKKTKQYIEHITEITKEKERISTEPTFLLSG